MPLVEGQAPIFFAHIPKCAGTSIHAAFEPSYDVDDVYLTGLGRSRTHLLATPCRFLQHLKYCGGHLSDFDCRHKLGEARKITTIREPLARLQSLLNHAIRGNWPGNAEAYRDGDMRALDQYLGNQYYRGSALISYHVSTYLSEQTAPEALTDAFVESVADRTARDYALILTEEDIDEFVDSLNATSRYAVESRRNVGAELGAYVKFKDSFDERVRSMMRPDEYFYELLLKNRQRIDLGSMTRRKHSWILNWDLPMQCHGFTIRNRATAKTSTVQKFTSRLFERNSASLHVNGLESMAHCSFSGLLGLQNTQDIQKLAIQLNGTPVEFESVNLSTNEVFYYGEIESHSLDSEWQFSFSSDTESPAIWFNDFAIHAFTNQ